jgi:putative transposase
VRFVVAHRQEFGVAPLCRVLGLPVSTFYDAVGRPPSTRALADADLAERIEKIWADSGLSYGSPRVHAALARAGVRVGRKRVERIMADNGWQGAYLRRGWKTTTVRGAPPATPVPDLVDRDFTAARPNQLWVADITYVRTMVGLFYLAMVLDVFSRRIIGWMMTDTLRTELVLAALEMAVHHRDTGPFAAAGTDAQSNTVIHHSDHGCQYTSYAFSQRLVDTGITASLGSIGDSFDNAMAESWFSTIKVELLYRRIWRTKQAAELAIFRWIEGWYNPRRIQDNLGWRSPLEYEAAYVAGHDLSIPATAKDAPVLDAVKHTTLDGACGPAQAREGGADKENGS